jgi:hypothetical protein
MSRHAAVFEVPAPQFGHPAGRRPSGPEPFSASADPDPAPQERWPQLRWVRCPVDEQLHLLGPAAVLKAVAWGYAHALCGRLIIAEDLTLRGSSGAPCGSCLATGTAS